MRDKKARKILAVSVFFFTDRYRRCRYPASVGSEVHHSMLDVLRHPTEQRMQALLNIPTFGNGDDIKMRILGKLAVIPTGKSIPVIPVRSTCEFWVQESNNNCRENIVSIGME